MTPNVPAGRRTTPDRPLPGGDPHLRHVVDGGPCPVCEQVSALIAERFSGPVPPPRAVLLTPDEQARRLAILADAVPLDDGEADA